MTLLRRRPREVYRVYAEDEFLGIDEWPLQADWDLAPVALDEPDSAPAGRGAPRRRLRQAVAIAIPAAVAMTVSAIVVHDLRSGTAGVRRRASLRSPVDRRLADNLPAKRSVDERRAGLREGLGRTARAARTRGGARRRHPRLPSERRGAHKAALGAVSAAREPAAVAVAVGAPATVVAGGRSEVGAARALSASTSMEAPARRRPEFGFER